VIDLGFSDCLVLQWWAGLLIKHAGNLTLTNTSVDTHFPGLVVVSIVLFGLS
jgi:hypothetical protein